MSFFSVSKIGLAFIVFLKLQLFLGYETDYLDGFIVDEETYGRMTTNSTFVLGLATIWPERNSDFTKFHYLNDKKYSKYNSFSGRHPVLSNDKLEFTIISFSQRYFYCRNIPISKIVSCKTYHECKIKASKSVSRSFEGTKNSLKDKYIKSFLKRHLPFELAWGKIASYFPKHSIGFYGEGNFQLYFKPIYFIASFKVKEFDRNPYLVDYSFPIITPSGFLDGVIGFTNKTQKL